MYSYLGTNGTICSSVHLEDIYYTRKIRLIADNNKLLTKDGVNLVKQVIVPEDEVSDWKEVDIPLGQV
jgi:uncharacterized protein YegJ (DUF2314 family)